MKKVIVGIITRINEAREKEFLLVSSRKYFGEYTGLFYPPGGKVEGDETEETALIREIKEELNLDVKPIIKITETLGDVVDQQTCWWSCEVLNLSELQINPTEIVEARWWTREAIITSETVWPATKKFFQKSI